MPRNTRKPTIKSHDGLVRKKFSRGNILNTEDDERMISYKTRHYQYNGIVCVCPDCAGKRYASKTIRHHMREHNKREQTKEKSFSRDVKLSAM
jgi:hypothetical protein